MLFCASKPLCESCKTLAQWMKGLTFLVFGTLGLLEEMLLIVDAHWQLVLSISGIVWGLIVLLNVGCKDCHK